MLASKLFFPTLKESPAGAELASHRLMLRAGLIRKLASGLYTWLPLGWVVLQKVIEIIRAEMKDTGAQEILMPAIQPATLWQETNRFEEYGPHLLKMQDRHQRDFCFGPTHEEVITDLARSELQSYKSLPLCLYQIQTKFRDEIRPRFGVMRAREFLMKDAYSFHLDQACLEQTYDKMYQAYQNILTQLGLKFRAVFADSGNIGGDRSQEFHVLAEAGEDQIVISTVSDYAANSEQAITLPPKTPRPQAIQTRSKKATPGITKVPEQAQKLGVAPCQILKTLLVKGASEQHPVVGLIVRGDHELNLIKAEKLEQVATPCTLIDDFSLHKIAKCAPGFVGPVDLNIPLFADYATQNLVDFACGANKTDWHYLGVNWGVDCKEPEFCDLRIVQAGDPSPDGQGQLEMIRGIEVGHIFQLGTKYSQMMQATVLDRQGKATPLVMGCYGMGVSRIVAAAIEQNHDQHGICWPAPMAPYLVGIIPIGYEKSEPVQKQALSLYKALKEKSIEVLLDDRAERPGIKFADLDLIGVPHQIIFGERSLNQGEVEYKNRRTQQKERLPIAQVIPWLQAKIM